MLGHICFQFVICFQEEKYPIRRIIIRGDPLAGKTTFLRKLAFDWIGTLSFSSGYFRYQELKKFSLVLPVILRLVQSKTTLFETLEFQLDFLEEKDINTIEWMLVNHAESVMLIYDGLDEYRTSACRDILQNIKGVKYPGSTVVITSRGEAVSKLNDWNAVIDLEAELQGFGSKEIFKYVNNYFHKHKEVNVEEKQCKNQCEGTARKGSSN